MKQISTIALLFILICCNDANGQNTSAELQAYLDRGVDPYFVETSDTISSYGPKSITRSLLQDSKGNMWFATWQGIMRYNGKVFTNYTLKDELIHFHVFSVFEDKKGNLWFGTIRGGVYQYDGKSFRLFTTKDGLGSNTVDCIGQDKTGNIWFGTDSGASRYDGESFVNFTKANGLSDKNINCIIQDKNGEMWFATETGLYIFDGSSFRRFSDQRNAALERVRYLLKDKTGIIWIAGVEGLFRYNGKLLSGALISRPVNYVCEDPQGNLWLSVIDSNIHYSQDQLPMNGALYRYDGKIFMKIIEKYKPGDSQIFDVKADKTGNIWFGTMKGTGRYDGKDITYFRE